MPKSILPTIDLAAVVSDEIHLAWKDDNGSFVKMYIVNRGAYGYIGNGFYRIDYRWNTNDAWKTYGGAIPIGQIASGKSKLVTWYSAYGQQPNSVFIRLRLYPGFADSVPQNDFAVKLANKVVHEGP